MGLTSYLSKPVYMSIEETSTQNFQEFSHKNCLRTVVMVKKVQAPKNHLVIMQVVTFGLSELSAYRHFWRISRDKK